ncbi:MAG: hypothetical protein JSW34_09810 [Candidatus Zixiibacteriota bacterium]|nr:MAG: hypothetical protein JSW34_09810 [candidate division Zixibacteria bacterium]
MAGRKAATQSVDEITMLDNLIREYYQELSGRDKKDFKPGDFLKMIELKRKLAPVDAEQKKFLQMLSRIRRETLGKNQRAARKQDSKDA